MSEVKEVLFTKSQQLALEVWKEKLQAAEARYRDTLQNFDEFMKTMLSEIGVDPAKKWKFNKDFTGMNATEEV